MMQWCNSLAAWKSHTTTNIHSVFYISQNEQNYYTIVLSRSTVQILSAHMNAHSASKRRDGKIFILKKKCFISNLSFGIFVRDLSEIFTHILIILKNIMKTKESLKVKE